MFYYRFTVNSRHNLSINYKHFHNGSLLSPHYRTYFIPHFGMGEKLREKALFKILFVKKSSEHIVSLWVLRFRLVYVQNQLKNTKILSLGRRDIRNIFAQKSKVAKRLKESEIRDSTFFHNWFLFCSRRVDKRHFDQNIWSVGKLISESVQKTFRFWSSDIQDVLQTSRQYTRCASSNRSRCFVWTRWITPSRQIATTILRRSILLWWLNHSKTIWCSLTSIVLFTLNEHTSRDGTKRCCSFLHWRKWLSLVPLKMQKF